MSPIDAPDRDDLAHQFGEFLASDDGRAVIERVIRRIEEGMHS